MSVDAVTPSDIFGDTIVSRPSGRYSIGMFRLALSQNQSVSNAGWGEEELLVDSFGPWDARWPGNSAFQPRTLIIFNESLTKRKT